MENGKKLWVVKKLVEIESDYDYYFSLILIEGEMIMAHIFIGAFTTAVFLLVIISAQKKGLQVKWWHRVLTFFEYIYFIFVLEVIYSFLQEGAAKGALVIGTILGFIALVWAFLLYRFVFSHRARKEKE